MDQKRKRQIFGILLAAFTLMFLVSLIGHATGDDGMIVSDEAAYGNPFQLTYENPGGLMGAYLSYIILAVFGWSAYPLGLFLFVYALIVIGSELARRALKHTILLWALVFEIALMFDISPVAKGSLTGQIPEGGGWIGQALVRFLVKLVGSAGSGRRRAARCFSTKSGRFPRSYRSNCCGCCRNANSNGSGATRPSTSMSAWCVPRKRICARKCRWDGSARICSTA